MKIHFEILPDADPQYLPPKRQSEGAAGYDICANLSGDIKIEPGQIVVVSTGFSMALPDQTEAQIRPRSGLAIRHGVTVVNAPGTIDCDYRGEVKIGLINLGNSSFTIVHGMRIAQMVIAPVLVPDWEEGAINETDRGANGFGSTGLE